MHSIPKGIVNEIFAEIERDKARREAEIPSTVDALVRINDARQRLESLGWSEGIYCPKDGSGFALVQWGSTGVHSGHYMGEWPDGHIYSCDFLVNPQAVMWKAIDKLTDDESAMLAESDESTREFIGNQLRNFQQDNGK